MVKRLRKNAGRTLMALALAAMLLAGGCMAAQAAEAYMVERLEGEAYFPSEENWTYHFTYAYPQVHAAEEDDYAALLINETYQEVLYEQLYLTLPMFANAEEMQFDGHNEVIHDFTVTCNNGRFLSIVQQRTQTMGEETRLVMESLVFDVAGEYLGETLTLRGLVMVGDSSAQISAAVLPVIYDEFVKLQESGVARADVTQEEFFQEFAPTQHFYADEAGNAVFFIPPMLLTEPSFEPPVFTFTPAELEALL